MKPSGKLENFLICIIVSLGILSLRLITEYPPELISLTENIINLAVKIIVMLGISDLIVFIKSIPTGIIMFAGGVFFIFSGIIVLSIFKRTMEQGTMIIIKSPIEIIKYGIIIYIFSFAIIAVYTYSVVGIPLSIIVGGVLQIVIFVGNVPLAIYIGYMAGERLNIKGYTLIYYLLGSFIILLCESIYAFGGAFIFFIFPVLSLGTVLVLCLNKFWFKFSYNIEFKTKSGNESFDREKIRDIIINGTEKKE